MSSPTDTTRSPTTKKEAPARRTLRMLPESPRTPLLHGQRNGLHPDESRARSLLGALLRIPWTLKSDGAVEVHPGCVIRQHAPTESADVRLLRGRVLVAGQRAVAFLTTFSGLKARPSKLEGYVLVKATDWQQLQTKAAEVAAALKPDGED